MAAIAAVTVVILKTLAWLGAGPTEGYIIGVVVGVLLFICMGDIRRDKKLKNKEEIRNEKEKTKKRVNI